MAHHGWVSVEDPATLTPNGLKAPFGRLFPAEHATFDSLGISLFAGPAGPLLEKPQVTKKSNPAGFTFLGQFIDHDLTEFRVIGSGLQIIDQNPTIGQRQKVLEDLFDPAEELPTTTNGRTGKLDLDSVYGLLGTTQSDLFNAKGEFDLETRPGTTKPDLKRGAAYRNGRLIADPRNDENKLVVQIHMLFELLHNKIHAASGGPFSPAFQQTRRTVQAIYRNIVFFDYLPRIVQRKHIEAVLAKFEKGTSLFQASNRRNDGILRKLNLHDKAIADAVAIPVEFSHAVFRLGHSQLLPGYHLSGASGGVRLFHTGAIDPAQKTPSAPTGTDPADPAPPKKPRDLRGNEALYDADPNDSFDFHVDWKHFFVTTPPVKTPPKPSTTPQHGQPIDGHLADSIFRLPPPSIGEPPQSLAERNIRRGIDFGLPSGQSAAAQLAEAGYEDIDAMQRSDLFPAAPFTKFADVLAREPRLALDTPLWYYILKEAERLTNIQQLGAVGGLIVAETLIGTLLEAEVDDITEKGRANAIRAAAAQRINDLKKWTDVEANEVDPHHILYFDRKLTHANEIHTMGQLIRYLQA